MCMHGTEWFSSKYFFKNMLCTGCWMVFLRLQIFLLKHANCVCTGCRMVFLRICLQKHITLVKIRRPLDGFPSDTSSTENTLIISRPISKLTVG